MFTHCCPTTGQYEADDETDSDAELAGMEEARVVMIGAPFAGKSTLLAQMRCLYRQGFSAQQRAEHAPIVHATTMDAALSLVDHLKREAGPGLAEWDAVYGPAGAAARQQSAERSSTLNTMHFTAFY